MSSKIFPQWCYFCRQVFSTKNNISICPQCQVLLPWWQADICANCNKAKIYCYQCQKQPPITPIFSYHSPIKNLIVAMKYRKNFYAARILKKLIANWLCAYPLWRNYDFIIPMPMHWRRFLQRNFHHSEYLLPQNWEKIIATRKLYLPPQTSLKIEQRKKILSKKIFTAPNPKNKLRGKKILLFDDVVTTKSTILNLAKELQKAKPKKIAIFCLARSTS